MHSPTIPHAARAVANPADHQLLQDIDNAQNLVELFLKRAVVGGIERVYEINRNFRNEGADRTHSPEFAMLEAYQAYGDYNQMAALTQELVQQAAVDHALHARMVARLRHHVTGAQHVQP